MSIVEVRFRIYLKDIVRNISNLEKEDLDKINTSIKINSIIKNVKLGKGIYDNITNGNSFIYQPLLGACSKYLKRKLGFSIYIMLKEITENIDNSDTIIRLTINEIFNILNYGKTSCIIMSKNNFKNMISLVKPIVDLYRESYSCSKDRFYVSDELDLSMIDNRIKLDKVHTVKLIKPTRPYGKNIIETLDSKIFMQPIVINNGLPINPAVWNICYYFNKKYNTNLVIRCIVPVNMEIKNCISYNISRFKENCSSYTEQRKSIPKKYRDKTSLLILSTMDWLLNNKPI